MSIRNDSAGLYTGYVIDDGIAYNYAKVQVWVPTLNGTYKFGKFKGIGANVGNDIDSIDLMELRSKCGDSWFIVSSELSGGNAIYDESTGYATAQRGIRDYYNINEDTNVRTYNSSGYGKSFKWKAANPAINFLQTRMLASKDGTKFETSDGKPIGTFAKLEIGTKVIVTKVNNGSIPVVLRKLPWCDEVSCALSISSQTI